MSKTTSTDSRRGTRRPTPTSRLPKPKQTEDERPSARRIAAKKAAEQDAAKEEAAAKRAERKAAKKNASKDKAAEKAAEKGSKREAPARRDVAPKREAESPAENNHTEARDIAEAKAARGTFVSRLLASEVRKRVLISLAVIVAILAMLYAPTRAYYIAWRTQLDLQARYDAIVAENEDINVDLDRLRSREGIEDEARKRGYVNPGETSVVVRGLPGESVDASSKANEVVAEVPWYLVPLDAIFGYEGI